MIAVRYRPTVHDVHGQKKKEMLDTLPCHASWPGHYGFQNQIMHGGLFFYSKI